MTIPGTVNKTGASLLLLIASAAVLWNRVLGDNVTLLLIWSGSSGGSWWRSSRCSRRRWAPLTTPLYALLEGMALGAISLFFEAQYPGIVFNAVGADVRSPAGSAGCLQLGVDSAKREPQARDRGRDGRDRARLPGVDGAGLLREDGSLHPRQRSDRDRVFVW